VQVTRKRAAMRFFQFQLTMRQRLQARARGIYYLVHLRLSQRYGENICQQERGFLLCRGWRVSHRRVQVQYADWVAAREKGHGEQLARARACERAREFRG
jgi:hypothetical protein